jgi:hypothetical protein
MILVAVRLMVIFVYTEIRLPLMGIFLMVLAVNAPA